LHEHRPVEVYAARVVATGRVPTDRALLVEASRDQLGDWQVLLLSTFGNRLHLTLRLALEAVLEQRLGYRPQCLHHDDGILIRLTDTDTPITDIFTGLTAENVEGLVLDELADSALFGLRFRQNAARALLFPRDRAGKRMPLWLQRLRGRDLLQVARSHPDFPIVGVGGVASGSDAAQLLLAGAHAVQVGTATFADPRAPARILAELQTWSAGAGVIALAEVVGAAHRGGLP
jgi:Lhr-like helicase